MITIITKYLKQNEGVLLQIIPNFSNDNKTIEQLISFINDISENRINEIMKFKKDFLNFSKVKDNIRKIINIFSQYPNVISYEIYSDYRTTCFNFWVPKKISKNFMDKIYQIWDGSKIKIYDNDYIEFDISKTQFTSLKFKFDSILPLNKDSSIMPNIISHLDNISEDEKVVIQFILRPNKNWHTKAIKSYERFKKDGQISNSRFKDSIYKMIDNIFSSIFREEKNEFDEDILENPKVKVNEMISKLNQKGVNINIRIGAQSNSIERSNGIINGIINAFKVMEGENSNYNKFIKKDLLPLQSKEKFYKHMKDRKIPIITLNNADVWVPHEMMNIIQLPTSDINSNKINRINVRQTFVPDELTVDSGFRMGIHEYNGSKNTLFWDVEDFDTLMRPTVVISNPGEGKSEMAKNKFIDWIKLGFGAAFMDVADGRIADELLQYIYAKLPHLKSKVVIIDCNDINFPPGLSNFSETRASDRVTSQLITQLWTEFYINFFSIDDHHRSKDFIRKSSIPIFSFPENTILEQYRMISSEEFRNQFLERIKPIKRLFRYWVWWNNFNSKPIKVKNEETKAILNKFDVLMDNDILKNIICQSNSRIPKFRDLMDNQNIVIIKAGEGAIGYETSRIIGALTLMKFWMAALSRYDVDEEERIPFKFFADEPQNYIASGNYIKEMLAKSRKYRFGLELFFQDPSQIEEKDKDLLKLLISMNPHLVLGKMGDDQYKKYFKERIFPLQSKEGTILPAYHWIVSIYKDKNPIQPFIMKAVEPVEKIDDISKRMSKVWVNEVKSKYAADVSTVEYEIQERELSGYYFDDDENEGITISGNAASL